MHIKAISISDRKGMRKTNVESAELLKDFGLAGDAHGGAWHRQVSLLAQESIETMRAKGLDVVAGNFAENLTTEGIDLSVLEVGDHIMVGETELIISQLGKICHNRCAIYHQAGDCVMPREGIFGVVVRGGTIKVGDAIRILDRHSTSVAVVGTAAVEKEFAERLQEILARRWSPGFVRFDCLNGAGDNLAAILKDLTETQAVSRVLIFDPAGRHLPGLVGFSDGMKGPSGGGTLINHCHTLEEVENI